MSDMNPLVPCLAFVAALMISGCSFPPEGRTPLAMDNRLGEDVVVGDPDDDHGAYRIPEGSQYNLLWAGDPSTFSLPVYSEETDKKLGCFKTKIEDAPSTKRGVIILDGETVTDAACGDPSPARSVKYCGVKIDESQGDETAEGVPKKRDCT